jgi:hypothetical protein
MIKNFTFDKLLKSSINIIGKRESQTNKLILT